MSEEEFQHTKVFWRVFSVDGEPLMVSGRQLTMDIDQTTGTRPSQTPVITDVERRGEKNVTPIAVSSFSLPRRGGVFAECSSVRGSPYGHPFGHVVQVYDQGGTFGVWSLLDVTTAVGGFLSFRTHGSYVYPVELPFCAACIVNNGGLYHVVMFTNPMLNRIHTVPSFPGDSSAETEPRVVDFSYAVHPQATGRSTDEYEVLALIAGEHCLVSVVAPRSSELKSLRNPISLGVTEQAGTMVTFFFHLPWQLERRCTKTTLYQYYLNVHLETSTWYIDDFSGACVKDGHRVELNLWRLRRVLKHDQSSTVMQKEHKTITARICGNQLCDSEEHPPHATDFAIFDIERLDTKEFMVSKRLRANVTKTEETIVTDTTWDIKYEFNLSSIHFPRDVRDYVATAGSNFVILNSNTLYVLPIRTLKWNDKAVRTLRKHLTMMRMPWGFILF